MADILTEEHSPLAIRWTREDCENLERTGILTERYELVEGVINKMGQNIDHANIVRLLLSWLFRLFGDAFVLTQTSIDVRPEDNPTSEPQPNVIVVVRPAIEFKHNPTPADLRLVIEASDSTLMYDLTTKARLYARAEIVEYWVVNLPERKLHVHRNPMNGTYQEITVYSEAESAAPLAVPDSPVPVTQLLPPAAPSE
ncbi:MAG TPA: Uma2 family endonuclease [Chthonomonadaceae bacterium]|nr:Uma2 family endonuclease [Chthonomonadaceae bacterium]